MIFFPTLNWAKGSVGLGTVGIKHHLQWSGKVFVTTCFGNYLSAVQTPTLMPRSNNTIAVETRLALSRVYTSVRVTDPNKPTVKQTPDKSYPVSRHIVPPENYWGVTYLLTYLLSITKTLSWCDMDYHQNLVVSMCHKISRVVIA